MPDFFNFIYVESRNFIFAYVPKVACTNWKCIFRYMMGHDDYLTAKLAHDRANSGLVFLSDIEERSRLLASRSTKKYSFVRNPYSRILSAYLNKIEPFIGDRVPVGHSSHFLKVYRLIEDFRLANFPEERSVNFFVFLSWLRASERLESKNEHWMPQYQLLHLADVRYDYIGKFENIGDESKRLLELMGCDLEFPSQDDLKFPGTQATRKIGEYYSERERNLVLELFRQDFDSLGYSSDGVNPI